MSLSVQIDQLTKTSYFFTRNPDDFELFANRFIKVCSKLEPSLKGGGEAAFDMDPISGRYCAYIGQCSIVTTDLSMDLDIVFVYGPPLWFMWQTISIWWQRWRSRD